MKLSALLVFHELLFVILGFYECGSVEPDLKLLDLSVVVAANCCRGFHRESKTQLRQNLLLIEVYSN